MKQFFPRLYLTVLLGCAVGIHCYSQDFSNLKLIQYTTKDGLPSNSTDWLETDKNGFLWVSTINGLSKFDGVKFVNYYGSPTDSSSLPDDGNFSLASDGNKLWVGGSRGLCCYNEEKNCFEYPFGFNNPALQNIQTIACGAGDLLWVGTEKGIRSADKSTKAIGPVILENNNVYNVRIDQWERLWYCAVPEMFGYIDLKTGKKSSFRLNSVSSVLVESKQKVWAASKDGLCEINTETGEVHMHAQPLEATDFGKFNAFTSLALCKEITGDSIIWASSSFSGLYVFNTKQKRFVQIGNERTPVNLRTKLLNFKWTATGQLWVSSIYDGLLKLDFNDQEFNKVSIDLGEFEPRGIAPDTDNPNRIWIATVGQGLIHYDLAAKRSIAQHKPLSSIAPFSAILSVCAAQNAELWYGTADFLYRKKGNSTQKIRLLKDKKSCWVNSIHAVDNKDYIWALTISGPCKVDKASLKSTLYPIHYEAKMKTIYVLRKLLETPDGRVWIASTRGLYFLNPADGSVKLITNGDDFSKNYLHDIAYDPKGKLWLGTNNGLYIYDLNSGTFEHKKTSSTERQGNIFQVLAAKDGTMWAFSDIGNFRSDMATGKIEKVLTPYIYAPNHPMGGTYNVFAIHDRFMAINKNELTLFRPQLIDWNPNPAVPLITEFRIRNKAYPFAAPQVSDQTLELNYTQNFLTFDFTANNHTQPERSRFKYMLEGADQDWNEVTLNRTANYPNLTAGTYTFKVMAANSAGVWNDVPAVFKMRIHPPWWESWWFRASMLSLLAGGGFLYFQNRLKKIKFQSEIREREAGYKQREAELQREVAEFQKEVAEVELSALRAQMNPHFVFNCLNSINTFILLNDPKNASNYLNKFSKLIRRVLDASRSEFISLKEELDTLKYYIELEQMRYGGRFQYRLELPENLDAEAFDLPPMLIQPYVENAIWHGLMNREGSDGLLMLRVENPGNVLIITVEDNGVGRKKAAALKSKSATAHKSHGLTVTDERIKIINDLYGTNASVKIEDLFTPQGLPCGVRVTLELPVKDV